MNPSLPDHVGSLRTRLAVVRALMAEVDRVVARGEDASGIHHHLADELTRLDHAAVEAAAVLQERAR